VVRDKKIQDKRIQEGKTFDQIAIGDSASHVRTITAEDIDLYARITDDYNPIHMDEDYARQTVFGGRIAHGTITLSLSAPVIGMKLPGQGCALVSIASDFIRPVRIGDTITAVAEVVAKHAAERVVELSLKFTNQRNEDVAVGKARVKPRKG
jgi:3-hydroxybutyryl-CoA dehydratase